MMELSRKAFLSHSSVGPPRPEKDKKGVACVVFDVVVHPSVVNDVKSDSTGGMRHFVVDIAISRIEEKYKTQLDRRYKLLAKLVQGGAYETAYSEFQAPVIEEIHEGPQLNADDGKSQKVAQRSNSMKTKRKKKARGDTGRDHAKNFSILPGYRCDWR